MGEGAEEVDEEARYILSSVENFRYLPDAVVFRSISSLRFQFEFHFLYEWGSVRSALAGRDMVENL